MRDPRRNRLRSALGTAVSLGLAGLAVWVLYRTFRRINVEDVIAQIHAVPGRTLLVAALCVVGAFATLAWFETVAVRYVKPGVPRRRAALTALIIFPLGHAVGQTVLSGGALRYRMYTPAGLTATEVGATVLMAHLPYALAFSFLLDLSLVLAADTLEPLVRISADWLRVLGAIGLAKDAGYVLLVMLRRKPVKLGGWAVHLPTPAMTALQFVVGAIDVGLISSVLFLLLPESAGIGYLTFLAVYLASVLAGVLSHVPAGLGVIESMLLLLLPTVPPEQLLAAVLLYRVLYEVAPLLLALLLWGTYESFARDGVRLRVFGRQARSGRVARPTAESSD